MDILKLKEIIKGDLMKQQGGKSIYSLCRIRETICVQK
jgi:hypothetical protein